MPSTEFSRPTTLFGGYIFDLDGTIYLGDQLLPGASDLIATLRDLNRPLLFLSNNPTRSRAEYVAKLGSASASPSTPAKSSTPSTP